MSTNKTNLQTAVLAGEAVTVRAPNMLDRILATQRATLWVENAQEHLDKPALELLICAATLAKCCTAENGAEVSIDDVLSAPDHEVSAVIKLMKMAQL